MRPQSLIFLILLHLASSCNQEKNSYLFEKVPSDETGVEFENNLKQSNSLNILNYLYFYNGAGVSVADFNNDNLLDLYFVSNQSTDKLYINRGDFKFKDATSQAGISNASGWSTGVSHVDINNDGLLDIYVCKVNNGIQLIGSNLLYVNQGIDSQGIPTFKEMANQYGLDVKAYSTQSAFFDYDLDGDLDMFLLTHSEHPNTSYGKGSQRKNKSDRSGDRLFENKDGVFVDVSESAKIYQGKIGYGLGLSISDINNDSYPDIYIGNDFFENDYYYHNNGDKTFTEIISQNPEKLGHTSHYSMGNSILDVNNDGLMDIVSLDMLPENLKTLKSSGVEEDYPTYDRYLKNGYAPQYMQNVLLLNQGEYFSEVAFHASISATEWSWGVLSADYDLDGFTDLYITNGIPGATNDMDYVNFISQENIQKSITESDSVKTFEFISKIPEKKEVNYAFKNRGAVSFEDVSSEWFEAEPTFSNGGVYGDLDNDGDLDLIINNLNQEAFIYRNSAINKSDKRFLKISFKGSSHNVNGIGAKVEIYSKDYYAKRENYPVTSFLSSKDSQVYFGLGNSNIIDSMKVTWPDGKVDLLYDVKVNTTLEVEYKNAQQIVKSQSRSYKGLLRSHEPLLDFQHSETNTLDFNRDPLVPFALSNEGPGIGVADFNNDSLDDVFICGAKFQPSELFIQQKDGSFISIEKELFSKDSRSEDIDQEFFDADNDGDLDLLVVSGGNEFKSGRPLQPRLYINQGGDLVLDSLSFRDVFINASVVKSVDLNRDTYPDLVIGSNAISNEFGKNSKNYVFINNTKGGFIDQSVEIAKRFMNAGLVNDIVAIDLDGNAFKDLIVVGDWMPITIFYNDGKTLNQKFSIKNTYGWWNTITAIDVNKDGEMDFVAGNWGTNTRLKASADQPITLYKKDIDDNGDAETLITYYYNDVETLLPSKDELAKQLPMINKKYLSYNDFASASFKEIIPEDKLEEADKKTVNLLSSILIKNKGNRKFEYLPLPKEVQYSSVNGMIVEDFNNDEFDDLLVVGNNYEISTQLGRLDASHGVLLMNDQKGFFNFTMSPELNIEGPARSIERMTVDGKTFYIVGINNHKPVFVIKENSQNE